jgi:hypothetical protein
MRRFLKPAGMTEAERAAKTMTRLLSDLTLDLHQVGTYMARTAPTVIYKRFIEVAESALYEKELEKEREIGYGHDPLF